MSSKASLLRKTSKQVNIIDGSLTKLGKTTAVSLTSTPAHEVVATGSATLTSAQVLKGIITQTPAANSTLTLPTAALLAGAFGFPKIGDTLSLTVINLAAITFTTTLAAAAGETMVGNGVVAPVSTGRFIIRFTNVTPGAQDYTVYAV